MTNAVTHSLTITQPDDWHVHLRDGQMMSAVVGETARHFKRALVMPNLVPPVVCLADAVAYRDRILAAVNGSFKPLMTLYLTDTTAPDAVVAAAQSGVVHAVKLYPAGATTHSDAGVTHIDHVMPVLEAMQEHGIVLCVHGEVTAPDVDIFDREARFIDDVLIPLRKRLPALRIVLEHVTTKNGVDYVRSQDSHQAATITPHHLIINRNHLLVGGIKPHYYCLPVAKRESHRLALVAAATSGDERFFLGTDSAPHTKSAKEGSCGCAGVFNASNTLACLAHVFDAESALPKLEAFTSLNGPAFYDLEPNSSTITLIRASEPVANTERIAVGGEYITVFDPGYPLYWRVNLP